MGYKEDLENIQKTVDAQRADEDVARAEAKELRAKRSAEAEAHIQGNNPADLGLKLRNDNGRIRLETGNSAIVVDVGVKDYALMILEIKPGSVAPTIVRGSQRRVKSLAEVDQYILQAMRS